MRVSQDERDEIIDQLGGAFADGRLDQPEFDRRVDAAMTAHTRAELTSLLADLPNGRTSSASGTARAGAPPLGGAPYARVPSCPPGPTSAAPVSRSAEECVLASLCHFTALVTSFIGPLVLLLTAGRDSAFVRDQAAESLNFQLTVVAASLALSIGTVLTFGLGALLFIPLGICWFFLVVAGCVGSLVGRPFRYPLNLRMID